MSRGDGIPGTASSGLSDWIRSQLVQQIRNLWKAKARRPSRWTESDSTQEPKELKKTMIKYDNMILKMIQVIQRVKNRQKCSMPHDTMGLLSRKR